MNVKARRKTYWHKPRATKGIGDSLLSWHGDAWHGMSALSLEVTEIHAWVYFLLPQQLGAQLGCDVIVCMETEPSETLD